MEIIIMSNPLGSVKDNALWGNPDLLKRQVYAVFSYKYNIFK